MTDRAPERVLVAVNGSDSSREAIEYACRVFPDARLVAVHAVDPVDSGLHRMTTKGTAADYQDRYFQQRADAEAFLADYQAIAAERGVDLSVVLRSGSVVEVILAYAEEIDADQLVVGTRGGDRSRSERVRSPCVAERLVRRASIPVAAVV
ncbi:universal stress protein [Natrialbaceae archaeon GCM10025810]|uniref:universal stress protein n=1 Tax=Halovalidus salilacus TaxID=3075124 RepID=UPI003616118F